MKANSLSNFNGNKQNGGITKHCPNCDSIPYPEDKFCFKCGENLVNECNNCHHIIQQKEFSFCPNCGVTAGQNTAKKLRVL